MDDFWSDLGWGLLIVLCLAALVALCLGAYFLWRWQHWVVWIPVVVIVVTILAVILGHLARDLFGDRQHRH